MPDDRPVAILEGEIGLLKSEIKPEQIAYLKNKLTLQTTPYKGLDPEIVQCYRDDGERLWMPLRERIFRGPIGRYLTFRHLRVALALGVATAGLALVAVTLLALV